MSQEAKPINPQEAAAKSFFSNSQTAITEKYKGSFELTGSLKPIDLLKKDDHKVTICHRTDSVKNPYVIETVDDNAADGDTGNDKGKGDHAVEHQGPIADSEQTAQSLKDQGKKWGDIIPAHDNFLGLNWNNTGKDLLENKCNLPKTSTETPIVTPTPTKAESPSPTPTVTEWLKTATATLVRTATVTATKIFRTGTPTATGTRMTETPTLTPTPTKPDRSKTPTNTPTPTPTGTITIETGTPGPSRTPTLTRTSMVVGTPGGYVEEDNVVEINRKGVEPYNNTKTKETPIGAIALATAGFALVGGASIKSNKELFRGNRSSKPINR